MMPTTHGEQSSTINRDSQAYWNKRAETFTRFATGEYERWLMDLLALEAGEEVLDMGCATGTLAVPLARAGHRVHGCDFAEAMLAILDERAAAEHLPITSHLLAWEDDWEAAGLGTDSVDVAFASRSLMAEAVVIPERGSIRQFVTQMKQHGALLAKGRLLGVQFEALFEDDLYVRIGAPAVEASAKSPPWTRCPARARGDGERARRAAHIQDLLARFEREQIEEPSLVVAGRVSRERRGPLVPIGLRVSVDCAVVCRHGLVLRCAYC